MTMTNALKRFTYNCQRVWLWLHEDPRYLPAPQAHLRPQKVGEAIRIIENAEAMEPIALRNRLRRFEPSIAEEALATVIHRLFSEHKRYNEAAVDKFVIGELERGAKLRQDAADVSAEIAYLEAVARALGLNPYYKSNN